MKENKSKAKKSLQLLLFFSLIMIFNSSIQIVINVLEDRPNWLILLLLIPNLIFIFIAIITSLDLVRKDYLTVFGRVDFKKGNIIKINTIDGEYKKFWVNKDLLKDIDENTEIELHYYKITKAVINIKNVKSWL
ncbi:hypothetical protein [Cohnella sp. AR92]|uniref:hypothetical protein n=1 Tax=Cohnella sp. AR92 TaxID=648716 RepID=UPI000F8D7985|nr:hypothetical protein [Cohnella sp. AR92]RUS47933.1 hypothetical protein ELR57_05180 [Cohnella sp. AR92]